MREWVDYLIHFRHEDPESSVGALTESTTIIHEEEIQSVGDLTCLMYRIEEELHYKQVHILAFSKIG